MTTEENQNVTGITALTNDLTPQNAEQQQTRTIAITANERNTERRIFLITWQGNPISTNFVCDDDDVNALLSNWCRERSLQLMTINSIDWSKLSVVFLVGKDGFADCLFEFHFEELQRFKGR